MRDILRRRINDPSSGGQYSDAELDTMINVAVVLLQKEILKLRPYGFLQWELWDIVADQIRYPMTAGTINLVYVGYRQSASATKFTKLDKKDLLQVINNEVTKAYAHAGREILLTDDLVSTAVATGLRAIHVPTLELSADATTTEDKGIPRPLDMAIVVWAHELLTPESGESRTAVATERKEMLADLPEYFAQDTDGSSQLRPDFDRYPQLSVRGLANDIH